MNPDEIMAAPILITRPGALSRMVETLRGETVVAVDTESNSLFAYREQVCLLQFSTLQMDYLVDTLALKEAKASIEFQALGEIFADRKIEKVFHAAEYDLICLQRDFDFEFRNLFDTMQAARILGWEAVGLGAVLENVFGVHLDKRGQRANWGQRPLPTGLLDYARLDTHYLIPLRNHLQQALQDQGLWELALEDFCRLSSLKSVDGNGRSHEATNDLEWWRLRSASDLSPQQAAVLLELCRYRDQMARKFDRPLFKVISDATLTAIAAECPRNSDELSRLPGMTQGQIRRHGPALLQAVQRGLQAKPLYPPRPKRMDESMYERLELLRTWRKNTAKALGMHSDVVLPRDLLYTLAECNPTQAQTLESALEDAPWRRERFGEQILDLLRKNKKR
jgi:ribonuclease D